MAYDLVIKHGRLITSDEMLDADVAVAGERIVAIGQDLSGARELDASGLYVIPGAVDGHVHLDNPKLPPYDPPTADTYLTGTVAAAFGGVTTLIDFAQPAAGESLVDELERRKCDAVGQAVIDYGLHVNYRDPDPTRLQEIPALFARGVPSFKLFMSYTGYRVNDVTLFRAMESIAAQGGLAIVHAENYDIILEMKRRLEQAGRVGPRWHCAASPAVAEAEGIHRALALAKLAGARALIFHISCAEGVRELQLAKARGQEVFGETCPHYLVYTSELFARDDIVVQSLLGSPPIRDATHQAALWRALADGSLDIISSDHCPRPVRPGQDRQLPGQSGLEPRLALVHTFGVGADRLTLNRWVEVCCTAPAVLFGLSTKGRLAPGYDADIVLFDPNKRVTITPEALHTPVPFSSFQDIVVTGYPVTTISRGQVIVADGELVVQPGRGRFIERSYAT